MYTDAYQTLTFNHLLPCFYHLSFSSLKSFDPWSRPYAEVIRIALAPSDHCLISRPRPPLLHQSLGIWPKVAVIWKTPNTISNQVDIYIKSSLVNSRVSLSACCHSTQNQKLNMSLINTSQVIWSTGQRIACLKHFGTNTVNCSPLAVCSITSNFNFPVAGRDYIWRLLLTFYRQEQDMRSRASPSLLIICLAFSVKYGQAFVTW